MVMITPNQGGSALPVHPDYKVSLMVDLTAPTKLAEDIWQNPRFNARLECLLLQQMFGHCDDATVTTAEDEKILVRMLGEAQENHFRNIGIAWFAPTTASDLLTQAGKARAGDLTDQECLIALAHRCHCDPSRVQGEPSPEAYQYQGMLCFSAWLWNLPRSIRDRVLLTLPAAADCPINHAQTRAAVFCSVMNDGFDMQEFAQ